MLSAYLTPLQNGRAASRSALQVPAHARRALGDSSAASLSWADKVRRLPVVTRQFFEAFATKAPARFCMTLMVLPAFEGLLCGASSAGAELPALSLSHPAKHAARLWRLVSDDLRWQSVLLPAEWPAVRRKLKAGFPRYQTLSPSLPPCCISSNSRFISEFGLEVYFRGECCRNVLTPLMSSKPAGIGGA